jgi:hypothetical protein
MHYLGRQRSWPCKILIFNLVSFGNFFCTNYLSFQFCCFYSFAITSSFQKMFINVWQIEYQHMKWSKNLNCIHWSFKKSLKIYTWIQIRSYYHPSKSPCTLFVFSKFAFNHLLFLDSLFFIMIFSCSLHYFVDIIIVVCSPLHKCHVHHMCHICKSLHHVHLILAKVFVSFFEVFQPLFFYCQSLSMYALHGIYEFFASSFHNLSHGLVCWRIFPFNSCISR